MRRFSIALMMIFTVALVAAPVGFDRQARVAKNFLQYHSIDKEIVNNYRISKQENSANVFELADEGFVVVTSDDLLPPVLAYSFSSDLSQKEIVENPFFDIMQHDINLRMKAFNDNAVVSENSEKWENLESVISRSRDYQQWPPENSTITDGWVETRWNQSGLYQRFCPLDNSDERSVVGCVSTALVQIMHFHRYAGNPFFNNLDSFNSGYNWPYIQIDGDAEERDFPTFTELNAYMESVVAHYEQGVELTDDDISAFNFACGVAVEMNWSSEGSGAYTQDVVQVLLNKFDYDTAVWEDYNTNDFLDNLAQSMQEMMPGELSIYDQNWGNGHAIICDGYNNDEFYHLNFGWGTSNSTTWYTLPEGMPNNYSIIGGAAMNIEGGTTPITLNGLVTSDISPIGANVSIEGRFNYNFTIDEADGSFELPLFLPGTYTVTASLGRVYYTSYEVEINSIDDLVITLGNFEQVTGNISGLDNLEGANIRFYKDGENVYEGIANTDGSFAISDVLPGDYVGTVSKSGGYFTSKEFNITLENQSVDFTLEEYGNELNIGYAGYENGTYALNTALDASLGIKILGAEHASNNDVISKVKFLSPYNMEGTELYAQLWRDNELLTEKQVLEYSQSEIVEVEFDEYFPISSDHNYYVGYRTVGSTDVLAYHDQGPNVVGKGGFVRFTTWSPLFITMDYNFCIEAVVYSLDSGSIQGQVNLTETLTNENTHVFIGDYRVELNESGSFTANIEPGTYTLRVRGEGFSEYIMENVVIDENETTQLETITLSVSNDNDVNLLAKSYSYPNPFYINNNRSGIKINYSIPNSGKVLINIFNVKGQLVNTLENESKIAGNYTTSWNARDKNNAKVSSGVYFYRIKSVGKTESRKMVIMK